MSQSIRIVKREVRRLLSGDTSGHADDHVERVAVLAERFAKDGQSPVMMDELLLTAWLHDVDDYKLVGRKRATELNNATAIMLKAGIATDVQDVVRHNIARIGYSRYLHGVRPERLAGQLVSDADMCDAIGACGIERALIYAVNHDSCQIFDPTVWPDVNIDAHRYNANNGTHEGDSFINYFFEKLLKLPNIMLTEQGQREAVIRQKTMVEFLRAYFREKNVPEWGKFLEEYLASMSPIAS